MQSVSQNDDQQSINLNVATAIGKLDANVQNLGDYIKAVSSRCDTRNDELEADARQRRSGLQHRFEFNFTTFISMTALLIMLLDIYLRHKGL